MGASSPGGYTRLVKLREDLSGTALDSYSGRIVEIISSSSKEENLTVRLNKGTIVFKVSINDCEPI